MSHRESLQFRDMVEVRINRPHTPFVSQRDRSDDEIRQRKDVASGSESTPKLRGSTPIIPRQRQVMNPTQFCGDPISLLFPAETEKNFGHDGADQGHAVVVQQFIKR